MRREGRSKVNLKHQNIQNQKGSPGRSAHTVVMKIALAREATMKAGEDLML
jgi:hypothetical protein